MGRWSMGFMWWFKVIITMPINLLLLIPFWVIKLFSKDKAWNYYENNKIMNKLDEWVWK